MLVQLTDVTGATVGVETTQIQTIEVAAGVTPASCFVRTLTQAVVIPGTVAVVAALLGGIAGSGIIYALVKQSDATFLGRNAAAIASGMTLGDTAVGSTTLSLAAPFNFTAITGATVMCGPLDEGGVTSLGTVASGPPTTILIKGSDFAGADADVNFWVAIIPTPA